MSAPQSHPFISFQEHWTVHPDTWFRLGQCKAIIAAISSTPLMPQFRDEIYGVNLIKGAQATTAIEGNTLSEEEIRLVQAGKHLPDSRRYMEQEVRNVLQALNILRDEIVSGQDNLVTCDLLRRFHRMIGKDLGEHFQAVPGHFRSHDVTVGNVYRPPPGDLVQGLAERFCEWSREQFHYERGQAFSTAILQAIVSHVYVAWIHPFGDGNGRTARLLEFYLLLRAGVPDIAAHILSNFYNETRVEYYRQLAMLRSGDLTGFIAYAVEGFKDGLQHVLDRVHENQLTIAWRDHVREIFQRSSSKHTAVSKRQMSLVLSMDLHRTYLLMELAIINEPLKIQYSGLSSRTLDRDIKTLLEMGLLIRPEAGQYQANTAPLRGSMAQARAGRNLLT